MAQTPRPFAPFEWKIAWRYIRARRAEGGVSVMTWISLVGISLAVFALIATLAVRSGFRQEFVDTIVGANAHLAVRQQTQETVTVTQGDQSVDVTRWVDTISDYPDLAARLAALEGVERANSVVRGEGLASRGEEATFVQIYGISPEELADVPLIRAPEQSSGRLADFGGESGVALGSGVARALGVSVGERITLTTAAGVQTAVGRSPRRASFDVVYIFQTGRYATDVVRVYMPLEKAQDFFNRGDAVDEIEVFVTDPDNVEQWISPVYAQLEPGSLLYSWKDNEGAYLRALTVEDNVMFVILSILVLIASMNIISGLIMLVKNKGRDIGILRTVGLTEGAVLRVFFLCGAGIGTVGTVVGVVLGCLFAIYVDQIFSFVNYVAGGGVWDPSIRGIYALPARLEFGDVLSAVSLSLALSWIVTLFPARRAARMNPVEALRYE
ncbi:ABC lipoprotein efflux transporter, inner membrane subunit, LolE [Oceanicola granulosus HTCC2516]|uniref:ABC lipoprotein efflux transporter, inner membrane subunit, LolE n=1 Tax=Oceanicola granulosus (strain ATCC BAA-861 / DSM 15982 / KCTC 12143 / HTCC2516) TaxID=314256 RepID=Q2CCM8_OCEGH|nr:ABC transporter permease [Oceanicola granulosus]EAR50385.1 ABC lipoprotein efflux transporter, inner membrane subunit, LolE [Oceanicola granulosus HTCC2516]